MITKKLDGAYTPGAYVPALDGIRGIAIILVMLHHFTLYSGLRDDSLADKLFYHSTLAGWIGVDLFFVLSGFLITGILVDAKGTDGYFRNFYARRFLRIFPLYYGVLIVAFLLIPRLAHLGSNYQELLQQQAWYWTYLINVRIALEGWPVNGTLAHFWSLAIEEQFYLVWPFVIFALNKRSLLKLCAALALISLVIRLLLGMSDYPVTAAYVLTIARIDTLAIGAFLAVAVRQPAMVTLLKRFAWSAIALLSALIAMIFVVKTGTLDSEDIFVQGPGFSIIALFFGSILIVALFSPAGTVAGRFFANKWLKLFGHYSYGLYVYHHPIALFLGSSAVAVPVVAEILGSQLPAQFLFTLIATVISLAMAAASYHFYEAHFLKLKRWFPYRKRELLEAREQYTSP